MASLLKVDQEVKLKL
uniref:Uncharacterized protein DKFZp686J2076 n=1 Tax=Homo sapiens TaxID=9606 RepID=Q6MZZ1_HUMAN|nr:hypothetical protein [Homo sapiens]